MWAHDALARVTRRLPTVLLRQPVLDALDRQGARMAPMAMTRMRLGYRMEVDLRSRTEVFAYWTGHYDTPLVAAARALLPADGVAVDAGANVGFWSVPLALRARTYAFEPLRDNVERLRRNAALNGVGERLHVEPVALSDAAGTAVLTLREDFQRGASGGNAAILIEDGTDDRFDQVEIALETLDDAARRLGVDRVDVLKIDVEGHEDFVLRGARQTLEAHEPVIFVEWNVDYFRRRGIDAKQAVADALDGLDYVALRRMEDGTWDESAGFVSPRPIDDLVLSPRSRAPEVCAVLTAP